MLYICIDLHRNINFGEVVGGFPSEKFCFPNSGKGNGGSGGGGQGNKCKDIEMIICKKLDVLGLDLSMSTRHSLKMALILSDQRMFLEI